MRFDLRIEWGHAHTDFVANSRDLPTARRRAETTFPSVKRWDWRGAVAFVDGQPPAEESFITTTEANLKREAAK